MIKLPILKEDFKGIDEGDDVVNVKIEGETEKMYIVILSKGAVMYGLDKLSGLVDNIVDGKTEG